MKLRKLDLFYVMSFEEHVRGSGIKTIKEVLEFISEHEDFFKDCKIEYINDLVYRFWSVWDQEYQYHCIIGHELDKWVITSVVVDPILDNYIPVYISSKPLEIKVSDFYIDSDIFDIATLYSLKDGRLIDKNEALKFQTLQLFWCRGLDKIVGKFEDC